MSKDAARKAAFAVRKGAQSGDADKRACENLLIEISQHSGAVVSGYMPIRTEVNPLFAMRKISVSGTVCVPIVVGRARPLAFHQWTPDSEMQDGPFGALVPVEQVAVVPTVLIIPLLSFDHKGFRLGYGGGFYDRTLELLRKSGPVVAIGFAYAAQQVEQVPTEATDQPLDLIVTEQGVITI